MGGKHGGLDIGSRGGYKLGSDNNGDPNRDKYKEDEKKIETKFKSYISKLEIRDKKIYSINEKRYIIEEVLSQKLDITGRHIIGSYARDTMINSVEGNDVDIMIVINDRRHGDWINQPNGPMNCLQSIKRIIENDPRFKNSEVRIDKNAVTIKYEDFSIDVVPAFKDSSGGYRIPDTGKNQSWKRTNPRMFKTVMNATDRANDGRVSKIVKIVKGWNESNGKPLRSFHIENMVYTHFKNQSKTETRSLTKDVENFFSRLSLYIQNPSNEPVYEERIDTYLAPKQRDTAIRKALAAKYKIENAKELRDKGKTEGSVNEYKKILGEKFG